MNFEALPCVLKNGEGTPMYGLLIRPLQNQQFVINVPSTSVNGQQQNSVSMVPGGNVFPSSNCRPDPSSTVYSNSLPCNRINNNTTNSSNGSLINNSTSNNNTVRSGRRNYPTILPRDNNINCNGLNVNNNNCKNSWNPVFIPATAVQNFQQSRNGSSSMVTAATNPALRQSFSSAVITANNSVSNVCQLSSTSNFDSQANMHQSAALTSSASSIVASVAPPQSIPQLQNQQSSSTYNNFNTSDINNLNQQQHSHLQLNVPYSVQQTNFNNNQQQQQQQQQALLTSDLEKIFQEFDANEINSLLQNLSYEGSDLVQVDPAILGVGDNNASNSHQLELLESGTAPPCSTATTADPSSIKSNNNNFTSSNYGSISNTNDTAVLHHNSNSHHQTLPSNSQRPPCRYQHFLMNSNNMRVNGGGNQPFVPSADDNIEYPTAPSFTRDPNLTNSNEIPYATYNRRMESTSSHSVQQQQQQQQPFQVVEQHHGGHHESGTPDSGIQSIGESPQALPQNSPMQHIASSHSPLVNSQMSPNRFFASSSFSPFLNQQQQQQNNKYTNNNNNQRRLSGDIPRIMEPLTVNTGCYEAVSDCETSPSTANVNEMRNNKSQGLLATSTSKNSRDSSNSLTDNDADFTDMPILEPEGAVFSSVSSSKETAPLSSSLLNNDRRNSSPGKLITNVVVVDNNNKIIEQQQQTSTSSCPVVVPIPKLDSSIVDPHSLVDKLLSSLAPDQLTSFSQLFEAKLKAAGINVVESTTAANLHKFQQKEKEQQQCLTTKEKMNKNSFQEKQQRNLNELRPTNGYVSDASSVSPPPSSVSKINNNLKLNEEKQQLNNMIPKMEKSFADENAMKKLNEYRLKMKQKLLNDTVIRELNKLCEIMNVCLTPTNNENNNGNNNLSMKNYGENNFFKLNWPTILERNNSCLKKCDKSTKFVDSLQNLEKEASESGSEDNIDETLLNLHKSELPIDLSSDHANRFSDNNNRFFDNNNRFSDKSNRSIDENMEEKETIVEPAKQQQQPLKLKLRLLRNNKSLKITDNKEESIKNRSIDSDQSISRSSADSLPLKKRFKHRNNVEKISSSCDSDDSGLILSTFGGRKRRKFSLERSKKKKNRHCGPFPIEMVHDNEMVHDKCPDLPMLSVQIEPMDVDFAETAMRLPTLSPQVSPRPCASVSPDLQRYSNRRSLEMGKKLKKQRLNPNLLRRCRSCGTWTKVSTDFCQLAPSTSASASADVECLKCRRISLENERIIQCSKSKLRKNRPNLRSADDVSTNNSKPDEKISHHLLVPKKKYVKSGLFVDRKSAEDLPSPFGGLTLSPSVCRLLQPNNLRVNDFCLPYDIWWECLYQKNYVCEDPSKNFRKIRSNLYVDCKMNPNIHCQSCNCQRPLSKDNSRAGCGEDCLNRLMFTECIPNSCQCGDKCSNQRFQKKEWCAGLESFDTKTEKGNGVRTIKSIKANTFICEYVGEIVLAETFAERMRTWYKHCQHHYALNLDSGTVIDGYRFGSIARFINHSCKPNCEMQKWMVNGHYRMGIFALRNIEAGEELTYNYNFHAFNDPQTCLCSSDNCTGAMGGNKQRSLHQARKNKPRHIMFRQNSSDPNSISSQFFKPLTPKERLLATKSRIFLLRNFDKLQRKLKLSSNNNNNGGGTVDEEKKRADMILAQLTALKSKARHVRTRRLAESEDNGQLQTVVSLAQVLQHVLDSLLAAKDTQKNRPFSTPFLNLPSKKKFPEYFCTIEKPVDFMQIKKNILSGNYLTPQTFDADVNLLLDNNKRTCESSSWERNAISSLEEIYEKLKADCLDQLKDVLGFDVDENFVKSGSKNESKPNLNTVLVGSYDPDDDTGVWETKADLHNPEDDKVRCVCGIFEEDGTMVQCDKCLYWVHGDCVGVQGESNAEFECEYCKNGRRTVKDVVLTPQPDIRLPQCVYYRSLLCGRLQIRLGQCVYLKRNVDEKHKQLLTDFNRECVRAKKNEKLSPEMDDFSSNSADSDVFSSSQSTYDRSDLRIMRVERLFIGPRGVKFVFGSYFAHPHETFCEPTRRFYKNEVFVTPLYDTWPLQTVVGQCLVLDPQTYCRGRPRYPKYDEQDVYVCEYRVDKGQRLFDKSYVKNRYPINLKPYIFGNFEEKLKITRDFTPFETKCKKSKPKGKPRKMQLTGKDTQEKNDKHSISSKIRKNKEGRLLKVIDKVVIRSLARDGDPLG